MSNTIIDLPWSNIAVNDIHVSKGQTEIVYNLILKAFYYKYKYEMSVANGVVFEVRNFNLNDIRVFNKFVSEALDKIIDPVAKEYTLDAIRTIKDNNFRKKCVKVSYHTLYNFFDPNKDTAKTFGYLLSNEMKIIDFKRLFKQCNRIAIDSKNKEYINLINAYRDAYMRYDVNKPKNLNWKI